MKDLNPKSAHQHLLSDCGVPGKQVWLHPAAAACPCFHYSEPKIPVSGLQAMSVRGGSSGKVWYRLAKGEWHILSSVSMKGWYLQLGAGSGWEQGLGLGLSRGDQPRVDQPCWQRSRKGHGAAWTEMLS